MPEEFNYYKMSLDEARASREADEASVEEEPSTVQPQLLQAPVQQEQAPTQIFKPRKVAPPFQPFSSHAAIPTGQVERPESPKLPFFMPPDTSYKPLEPTVPELPFKPKKTEDIFGKYVPSSHVYDHVIEQEGTVEVHRKEGNFRGPEGAERFYLFTGPAGYPLIGYGHLITKEELESGIFRDGLSEDEAYELLRKDVQRAVDEAEEHFGKDGWAAMGQAQKDAIVDHFYVLGPGDGNRPGMKGYPRLTEALRAGDWETVAKEGMMNYKDPETGEMKPMPRRNEAWLKNFVNEHLTPEDPTASTQEMWPAEGEGSQALTGLYDRPETGPGAAVHRLFKGTDTQIKDITTQGRRLAEDVVRTPEMLAGILDTAYPQTRNPARDAISKVSKAAGDFVGPSEEAWSEFEGRHPGVSSLPGQLAMGMMIPGFKGTKVSEGIETAIKAGKRPAEAITDAMNAGAKISDLSPAQKVMRPLKIGKKDIEFTVTEMAQGQYDDMRVLMVANVPVGEAQALTKYDLAFDLIPSQNEIHVNWFGPKNLGTVPGERGLAEGSNMLQARDLREVARQVQEMFPFVGDNWMLTGDRVGGRAGVKARSAIGPDPSGDYNFSYQMGRLTGNTKKNARLKKKPEERISYEDWQEQAIPDLKEKGIYSPEGDMSSEFNYPWVQREADALDMSTNQVHQMRELRDLARTRIYDVNQELRTISGSSRRVIVNRRSALNQELESLHELIERGVPTDKIESTVEEMRKVISQEPPQFSSTGIMPPDQREISSVGRDGILRPLSHEQRQLRTLLVRELRGLGEEGEGYSSLTVHQQGYADELLEFIQDIEDGTVTGEQLTDGLRQAMLRGVSEDVPQ